MEAKLTVVGGEAHRRQLKVQLPVIIGRSRQAGVTIPHPLVSRQHCELFESHGQVRIRDLGSLNGTFLGQEQITDAALPPKARFTVGPLTFQLDYLPEKKAETAGGRQPEDETIRLEPEPADDAPAFVPVNSHPTQFIPVASDTDPAAIPQAPAKAEPQDQPPAKQKDPQAQEELAFRFLADEDSPEQEAEPSTPPPVPAPEAEFLFASPLPSAVEQPEATVQDPEEIRLTFPEGAGLEEGDQAWDSALEAELPAAAPVARIQDEPQAVPQEPASPSAESSSPPRPPVEVKKKGWWPFGKGKGSAQQPRPSPKPSEASPVAAASQPPASGKSGQGEGVTIEKSRKPPPPAAVKAEPEPVFSAPAPHPEEELEQPAEESLDPDLDAFLRDIR